MPALFCHAAHDLRLGEMPAPDPGPGEVRVRVERGGICGSDLHYFHAGGFGHVRIREPMVLGHEIAGRIEAVGAGVADRAIGEIVAVNPSRACGVCAECRAGRPIHCGDMRFLGSAMRFPHVHGGFRDRIVVEAARALPVGGADAATAAFCEPLAVCLHAVARAGEVRDRRVLVTGAGPIGALTVLAARRAGAAEIVATDVAHAPLAIALKVGATRAIDVGARPEALEDEVAADGQFDVMFECSGNGRALAAGLVAVRPNAVVVQVGMAGEVSVPLSMLVAKEIELRGTFRFGDEFALAARLVADRQLDLAPLLTDTLPLSRAVEAFELASDRNRAMKVQLSFS